MAEKIGRLGFLGLAVESTPGDPEASPSVFIPFTENLLRGHHEPISDIAARTSRVKDASSVIGKKWGEGSVQMYLDSINAGYFFKLALGQEARTQKNATPPIHDHLLQPTVSGNIALTATLWDNKGVDSERYSRMAIDTLEVVIADGIATVTGGFMGGFPSTVTAPSLTTTSGTLYTWKDMGVRFGDTVVEAKAASATEMTEVTMNIGNAIELNYGSGSNEPRSVTYGPLEITGTYKLFFENATDRDKYYNLTKKSMVILLTGAALGVGGYSEQIEIVFKKVIIEDLPMETGLDDLFAITASYRAEIDRVQAGYVEATFRNGKPGDYS